MMKKKNLEVARELGFKAFNKILFKKLFISNPDLPPLTCISVAQHRNDGLLVSPPPCREITTDSESETQSDHRQTNRSDQAKREKKQNKTKRKADV